MHAARQPHGSIMVKEEDKTEEIDELESSPSLPSFSEVSEPLIVTIVAIAGLLEIALHNILFLRQVYPIDLFERRKKYGIPVFQCIEGSLNEYISEVIRAVSDELVEDAVSKFIISIHQSDTPLEKFIFSFDHINRSEDKNPGPDKMPLDVLQRQMRAMLMKLNGVDAMLSPFSPNDELSFSVVMHLREKRDNFQITENELNFDFHEEDRTPQVHPPALIHMIDAGNLRISLHVQEAEAKLLPSASKTSETNYQAKTKGEKSSSSSISSRSSTVNLPR